MLVIVVMMRVIVMIPVTVVVMMVAGGTVIVTVTMVVPVRVRRVVAEHTDVRARDPGPQDPLDDELMADAEAAQRLADAVQRQAGVQQGTEHHVAGRAGKAVEVHHARHQRRPVSLNEQYRVSARIT